MRFPARILSVLATAAIFTPPAVAGGPVPPANSANYPIVLAGGMGNRGSGMGGGGGMMGGGSMGGGMTGGGSMGGGMAGGGSMGGGMAGGGNTGGGMMGGGTSGGQFGGSAFGQSAIGSDQPAQDPASKASAHNYTYHCITSAGRCSFVAPAWLRANMLKHGASCLCGGEANGRVE